MTPLAIALITLAAALLFCGGVGLLGLGAWVWARAIADVFRSRSHRISADAQEETVDSARDALDDIHDKRSKREGYIEPTDEELRAYARADAPGYPNGDITTMRNEQIEESSPIPPDTLYMPDKEEVA